MKKKFFNKSRLVSGLLIATTLSTCVLSGTFARYVSTTSATDTARVTKWGVVLTAEGTLYGEAYGDDSKAVNYDKTAGAQTVRVDTQGTNVIAPGTKSNGNGLLVSVKGQPEVKTQIDAAISYQNIYLAAGEWGVMVPDNNITEENFDPTDADLYVKSGTSYTKTVENDTFSANYYRLHDHATASKAYYPVVYTGADVTGKTYADDSLKAVAQAIGTALNGSAVTFTDQGDGSHKATVDARQYEANTDLTAAFANLVANPVSWEWAFETNAKEVTDPQDTILGDLINGLNVGADAGNCVVYRTSSAASYGDTVTDEDGVVKTKSGSEIGGTKTAFNIEITAKQVD